MSVPLERRVFVDSVEAEGVRLAVRAVVGRNRALCGMSLDGDTVGAAILREVKGGFNMKRWEFGKRAAGVIAKTQGRKGLRSCGHGAQQCCALT